MHWNRNAHRRLIQISNPICWLRVSHFRGYTRSGRNNERRNGDDEQDEDYDLRPEGRFTRSSTLDSEWLYSGGSDSEAEGRPSSRRVRNHPCSISMSIT